MAADSEVVRIGEWLTIGAALLGPILAVQAQKIVEAGRAKRQVKNGIFRALMATRASRLSPDHVQALNMVNIAFYGRRFLRMRLQSAPEKAVCRAWRDYFDSLEVDSREFTEGQDSTLSHSRFDKFIVLLEAIAIEQNYDFDPVDLRKNAYSPQAHGTIENELHEIRAGLAGLLAGRRSLPMEITNLPRTQQSAPPSSDS